MKSRNPEPAQISNEEFVRLWQTTRPKDIAEKLGWTSNRVANRAAHLRKKGVPLKMWPKNRFNGRPATDYSSLIELAKSFTMEEISGV